MKLSIITVCLNSASTIEQTIQSVLLQCYSNIEYIVLDGGSSDGTQDIIGRYSDRLAVYRSEPDKGLYDAMNKGIALATGEVVGILNADDFYADSEVLHRVATAFNDLQVDACYGDLVYVKREAADKIVRYWKSQTYTDDLFYRGWMPPHPTFFVRRNVYEQLGGFKLEFGSGADYELMLRFLLRYGIKTSYIPALLVHMRCGGISGESFANRWRANRMDRKAWDINGLHPKPWTLLMKPLSKISQFFT